MLSVGVARSGCCGEGRTFVRAPIALPEKRPPKSGGIGYLETKFSGVDLGHEMDGDTTEKKCGKYLHKRSDTYVGSMLSTSFSLLLEGITLESECSSDQYRHVLSPNESV
jgi:hypothetical protein